MKSERFFKMWYQGFKKRGSLGFSYIGWYMIVLLVSFCVVSCDIFIYKYYKNSKHEIKKL